MYHDPRSTYRQYASVAPRAILTTSAPSVTLTSEPTPEDAYTDLMMSRWLIVLLIAFIIGVIASLISYFAGADVPTTTLNAWAGASAAFYPPCFRTADDYLGKKADRPLPGRATRLQRRADGSIAVKYQRTDVVTYRQDGSILLNSDGYHTLTTRQRINEYTQKRTWSEKGTMYIGSGDWSKPGIPFADGTIIGADGEIIVPESAKAEITSRQELSRRILKYARLFSDVVKRGELGEPSTGDCLYCQMELSQRMTGSTGSVNGAKISHGTLSADGTYTDRTHTGPSPDHYLSHLEEGYVMGSVLANAIIARNYGNPQWVYSMIVQRKDGKWAAQIVRHYLRSLLPQLAK